MEGPSRHERRQVPVQSLPVQLVRVPMRGLLPASGGVLSTDRLFLPSPSGSPELTPCCLLVHENLLVVHSENYVLKFTAGQAGQLVQYSQVHVQTHSFKWSNSQPVLDSTRGLYFVIWCGEVYSISLETGVKLSLT